MHLWCRLILLATTTLNRLYPSYINPRLSVEEYLNSVFDYNKIPISPLGYNIVVYETLEKRGIRSSHT